jgi:GNAT superfamily N-acetyltransferase
MLTPATASDLPFVRSVVQDGAASGAFEEELQGDSLESHLFFSNIHRVLMTGIMQVERPVSGEIAEVPAICYLLHEIANGGQHAKQGFGIFKTTPISIERWLLGVAPDLRGRGIGRMLIDSLMKAPQAKNCFLARACKHSAHYSSVSHLLTSHRFVRRGIPGKRSGSSGSMHQLPLPRPFGTRPW